MKKPFRIALLAMIACACVGTSGCAQMIDPSLGWDKINRQPPAPIVSQPDTPSRDRR